MSCNMGHDMLWKRCSEVVPNKFEYQLELNVSKLAEKIEQPNAALLSADKNQYYHWTREIAGEVDWMLCQSCS